MIDVRESTDKLKILIVDDSELNRELLAGMLGDEYEIYQVENGKKAIDILEENREQFKLVLLDINMPVMNGYEATKAIRRSSHELAKKIPIIAMTANAFSEDIQHSLAAGMNAHVSKPVEMKVLEKTIRSIKSGGGGYRTAGY